MTWLKSNWKFVATILTILAAVAGVKFTTKEGPSNLPPEVIVIIPGDDPAPNVVLGKSDAARPHSILYALCKIKAARLYAAEKDLPFGAALHMARSVPDDKIASAIAEAKVNLSGAPVGGPLQNLLDWIAAHPEVVQQIIQLILMLIPLFADAHEFPEVPLLPFNGIWHAQVEFPLAWDQPWHSLAA